jgi:hypothetical protein
LVNVWTALGARLEVLANGQMEATSCASLVARYRQGSDDLAEGILHLTLLDNSLRQLDNLSL